MKHPVRSAAGTWLPLKPLIALGLLIWGILLAFLPIWYATRTLESEIETLKTRIQTQELLQPLMHGLRDYLDESEKFISATPLGTDMAPLPAPDNLAQVLQSLLGIAALAGVHDARFVPVAETVLDSVNGIRLEGEFTGTLEQFRCFSLLLSAQPWLSTPERLEILSTEDMPVFTLSLWAVFRRK